MISQARPINPVRPFRAFPFLSFGQSFPVHFIVDMQDARKPQVSSIELRIPEKESSSPKAIKSSSVSIDEKTLNDPDSLLRNEREALNSAIHEPDTGKDDFPDGGLRAWLVVFGVSP